jgi:hypothetical protein
MSFPLGSRGLEMVKSSRFTTQEVEGALLTLAMNGGNAERAAKQLNAAGVDVSARTLRDWRTKCYPRLYADMFTRHRGLIQDQVVNDALANAAFAGQAVRLGLEENSGLPRGRGRGRAGGSLGPRL